MSKIRNLLPYTVDLETAQFLRARLEKAGENYQSRRNPAKVLAFIAKHADSLRIFRVPANDLTNRYVWQVFTTYSGWVFGDSIQECLDKAMRAKKDWSGLSEDEVTALILVHQVIKDEKAD